MSTIHLIIGDSRDTTRMSQGPLKEWPNLAIDPIDNVSLAKLFALLTGDSYDTIIGSFLKMTPDQPDVEPWDIENLIPPVLLIPERYVSALAGVRDELLLALAGEWGGIEEFSWYRFDPRGLRDQLACFRDFASQCLAAKKSLLLYLAP
jgi:hypothetical protein